MGTTILILWVIGILFSWCITWFYKYHWAWYFIMIPLGWCGIIAFFVFVIEKAVNLRLKKIKK